MNEQTAINILIESVNSKKDNYISQRKELRETQKYIDKIRSEVTSAYTLEPVLKEWGLFNADVEKLFGYLRSKGKDFVDKDASLYQRFLSNIEPALDKKYEEVQYQIEEMDRNLSVVSMYDNEDSIITNLKSIGDLIGVLDLPAETVDEVLVSMAKLSFKKYMTLQTLKAQFDEIKEDCSRILEQKQSLNFVEDDEKFKNVMDTYSKETREKVMFLYQTIKRDLMENYEQIRGAYGYLDTYLGKANSNYYIETLIESLEKLKHNVRANSVQYERYKRIIGIEPCSFLEEITEEPEKEVIEEESNIETPPVEEITVEEPEVSEEVEVEIPQADEASVADLNQDVMEMLGNSLYEEDNEKAIFENYRASIMEAKRLLEAFNSSHEYLPANGSDLIDAIRSLKKNVTDIVEMKHDNELLGGPKEDVKFLFGGIIDDIDISVNEIKENLDYCLATDAIPQRVYDMFFPPVEREEQVEENALGDGPVDEDNVEEFADFGDRNIIIFLKDGEGRFCFDVDLQKLARKKDSNLHDSVVKAFQKGLKTMTNMTYEELKNRNTKVRDITGVSPAVKKKYDPKRVREGIARMSLVRLNVCEEVKQKICSFYKIKPEELSRVYLVGGVMLKEGDKGSTSYSTLIKELSNRENQRYIDYLNKLFSNPKSDIEEINKIISESGDACRNLSDRYILG